jgi:hypothetical protein
MEPTIEGRERLASGLRRLIRRDEDGFYHR